MKKQTSLFLLLFLLNILALQAQGFKHPGALHTQEDFERIKAQLAAKDPAVVQGYENLKANGYSSSTTTTYPVEIVKRGIAGDENYINAARGAAMAYQNALRWKISGDVAHANKAVQILNDWARICKGVSGNSNLSLASGLYGYEFANAAEIMRDYSGWKPEDFKKFQKWMLYVWYPPCIDFLKRRHGTNPGHYWSNWGLCNALAVVSIGILCDDVFIYNQGMSYYKYDLVGTYPCIYNNNGTNVYHSGGYNEFIGNLVPAVYADTRGPYGYLGQNQESGRDQGHATMAVGLAVDICQVGWNQGDDVFAHMDNRLAAGIEYIAAYNSGIDALPWTEYWYHDVRTSIENSWKQTFNNEGGRGQVRPYWDRVLGHYEGVKGITLTYSRAMKSKITGADWGGSGGTSGGYDHLGFTTLTCTRPAVTPDQAPVSLKQSILYNSKTYAQGELSLVTPGSLVKLMPQLPIGETNTGNWAWSTGAATQDLEVTPDKSTLYHVTYTNAKGVKSTQLFSIAVTGDCLPDSIIPSINVNGVTYNDTVVTIMSGTKFNLSISPRMGYGTYKWNTNAATSSITVENLSKDSVYSVIYTNQGGRETKITFHVKIYLISPALSINGGAAKSISTVRITKGQSLKLMPAVVKTGMENGTWKWSNGSTSQYLQLDNLQESQHDTVIYTYDGKEYKLDFHIYVVPFANAWSYWPLDEGKGTIAADVWAGNDAAVNSGIWTPSIIKRGIQMDGTASSFLQMPKGIVNTLNDFTISVWVKLDAQGNWARIWDFGSGTNDYMFLTSNTGTATNPVRFAIKVGGGAEQQINCSHVLQIGIWTHIAVARSGNTGVMYINGTEVGRNENLTLKPADLGLTSQNYIGKSQFADALLKGTVDEIYIHSSALSASEVMKLVKLSAPAPSNLSASFNSGDVSLTWDAVAGAASYYVKRATVSGGPYTIIRTGVTTNSYMDTTVISGNTYYYVLTTVANGTEGLPSNEVSVSLSPLGVNSVNSDTWKVYPNPFKNKLTIFFDQVNGAGGEISVMDTNGQIRIIEDVKEAKFHTLDMSNLPSGVYFLKIKEDRVARLKKVVKI